MGARQKPDLRIVAEGDGGNASKRRPSTVVAAIETGSRVDELRAMQLRVARAIDDPLTPARDLAALTRRQIEIGREIEAIEREAEEEAREHEATPDDEWDASSV